jgi:hypothetical protein
MVSGTQHVMETAMPNSSATRTQPPEVVPSSTGQKPVDKFRDGPVHASIWENQGPKGAFRTASFQLRYTDGQTQWPSGHSYNDSALLHLEKAASEARSRIEKWRQSNAARHSPHP